MAEVSPRLCIASEISGEAVGHDSTHDLYHADREVEQRNPQQFPPPASFQCARGGDGDARDDDGRDGGNVHDEVGDARGRKVLAIVLAPNCCYIVFCFLSIIVDYR